MGEEKAKPASATLLLSCTDHRGIVAEISHFIYQYGGNVIHSDQHRDDETGSFFMRIEWSIGEFEIPPEMISQAFEPLAHRFAMKWTLLFYPFAVKTAIFVSHYDHCLYDLLLCHRASEFSAEIPLIISNHETCRPIADYFGVEFHHIPVTKSNKNEAEEKQQALLEKHGINLVILARYMQILSSRFVKKYENRIINIHHSFLPAFIGAKPYHQAYARGVKIIGATSHYVTEDLDHGPIIEQDVVRISHRDSVADLVQKGKNLEKKVLSRAVRLHLEQKVLVYGNKTVIFD